MDDRPVRRPLGSAPSARDRAAPVDARTAVVARILASRPLRRVELAFAFFNASEYGVWTAMIVYAYGRGGARAAGLIAAAQLLPAALVAPAAAPLADRRGGAFALRLGYAVQAGAMALTAALLLAGAPAAGPYAGAILAASAVTLTRPAHAALLPELVSTPDELTAANVVSGWVESASLFAGPALAGVLIALHGPGAAFALFAALTVCSTILVSPLGRRRTTPSPTASEGGLEHMLAGLRALRADRRIAALVLVLGAQFLAMGALDVLEVVLAESRLGLGPQGAGYLGAAFGAGGLLGGVGTFRLVGRPRMTGVLLGAAVGWGAAFVLLGLWVTVLGAFMLLALAGTARVLLDVSGRVVLQRVAPAPLRARLFGALEGLAMLALAAGSLLVPAVIALSGSSAALVASGALLAALALAAVPAVRSLDRVGPSQTGLRLLRGADMFAGLSTPSLEGLAYELTPISVARGDSVVRQGDVGDRFYIIRRGRFDVTIDGRLVNSLGPGQGFGELALLRDAPRAATVTAREPGTVFALAREPFLVAVASGDVVLPAWR